MDNQAKMPKFEGEGFLPEVEKTTPEAIESNTPENFETAENIEDEPLIARFETKPELLGKSDDSAKKKDNTVIDADNNGVTDEDDALIAETFKGSKADDGGTSRRVEDLIRKTDKAILKKEKNPYKFMNYWRKMKQVAMEEWFNRKIGEGLGGDGLQKRSIESTIGERQNAAESLAILQNKQTQRESEENNGGQVTPGEAAT